jgi:hypothetical protein
MGVFDPEWREATLTPPDQLEAAAAEAGVAQAELATTYADYLAHHRALRAMAALPPEQVAGELALLWERVRAGTLALEDLPGGPG